MRVRPFYLLLAGGRARPRLAAGVAPAVAGAGLAQGRRGGQCGGLGCTQGNAYSLPRSPADPLRNQTAAELLSFLQQRLEQSNARSHEGVLSFTTAEAYRKFLARAQQSGLTVTGQLDALLTVRVHYDNLTDLQRELLQNAGDYAEVGANYLLQVPTVPSKEERAAVNQVPFGNDTLAFPRRDRRPQPVGPRHDHCCARQRGLAGCDLRPGAPALPGCRPGHGAGTGTEDGHGTAVAALAAGVAPDAPGVAPAAGILSIRVTGADGLSDIFTLSQAIVAAVQGGAQIINISMGGYASNGALTSAIDYAVAHGAVIVAAAGNDQAAQLTWPAADPRVISVGAVDALEQQVLFSNSGPQLQVTAPGFGVQTAWLDGQRVLLDGTSASAPIVAGAIAAVMSVYPQLNASQAWQLLQQSASDAGAPGDDPDYGNGILNLGWAMNRTNPAHIDTAVSSHYYDGASGEMEFVVQNRSGVAVTGMTLDVNAGGADSSYDVPRSILAPSTW